MKRKSSARGGPVQIKKLQLSVQHFVEKAETRGAAGFSAPAGRAKSRKELRKEKRLSKKIRRKAYYERKFPGKHGVTDCGASTAAHPAAKKPPAPAQEGTKDPPVKKAAVTAKRQKKKKLSKEEARKKHLLEANEKEDKEIKRLERSLRMNRRRNKSSLPQAFTQDGLDYILGVLEPGGANFGLYDDEEEEANTAEKLHKLYEGVDEEEAGKNNGSDEAGVDDGSDEEEAGKDDGNDEEEARENDGSDEEGSEMGDDSDGEEEIKENDVNEGGYSEEQLSEEDEAVEQELEVSREEIAEEEDDDEVNKSVTVTKAAPGVDQKYVPPHLRRSADAADAKRREELERLRKSVKGLMNSFKNEHLLLSEPNMASISGQLEELYMSNSRKDMSDTLSDIALNACITPAKMPDRLMMEHVLLISILHHTVGIEVGAHILETVVKQFHDQHGDVTDSKECDNLLTFIGHLYNFHIIDSRLVFVFDLVFRRCWCPHLQRAVDKKFQDQSRVRFMLEIMLALKNNDMRKIPGYDPEPVEKLLKLQRSLVHHNVSGSDTRLRVSLENILEADKIGRWWIVGSSWSGAPMIGQSTAKTSAPAVGKPLLCDADSLDFFPKP
ncbi:unnamed protein product [Ranitomeya imitator]|uniref:MIF4G domain-containing protein n=1 Tax=Ranitomeya imitator TaxID=111125 RepID=A0ABN9KRN6_9NEOB|nr:unnamed protein product [Ranitomeya imitator]